MGQRCCLFRKDWWIRPRLSSRTSNGTVYHNDARKPDHDPVAKSTAGTTETLTSADDEGVIESEIESVILQAVKQTETPRFNLGDFSSSLSSANCFELAFAKAAPTLNMPPQTSNSPSSPATHKIPPPTNMPQTSASLNTRRFYASVCYGLKEFDHKGLKFATMQPRSITDGIKHPLVNNNIVSRTFNHNGGVLTSKDGIKIIVPEGATKKGDCVSCHTVVDLCGRFEFPSNCQTNLVSPYYWIGVTESYHFHKPVQVEFEHFGACICDPSHYQLLCCEDNDESYTMRPVDYELSFTVRGDKSLCTFQTDHFCSYCLIMNIEGQKHIGAFCLKPNNFQFLDCFNVEILFSYVTSKCMCRIETICKKRNMIFDKGNAFTFETPHKTSKSYVQLAYKKNTNGWKVRHIGPDKIDIESVNIYNYTVKELQDLEERSVYPPRFTVNINRDDHMHSYAKTLDTNLTVTLYSVEIEKTYMFKVYVAPDTNNSAGVSKDNILPLFPYHDCNKNKAEYKNLIKYSEKIAEYWEEIAAILDISEVKVDVINRDHQQLRKKCNAMFKMWQQLQSKPCWCHFIRALYDVSLNSLAEEVTKEHLKPENICEMSSDITSVVEGANMDIGSPESPGTASSDTFVSRDEDIINLKTEYNKVTSHDLVEANMDLGSPDSPGTVTLDTNEDQGKSNLKTKDNVVTLHDLMRHVRNIPDYDLDCFIQNLLPTDQVKSVIDLVKSKSLSNEDKIEKICEEILKQNPSWTEVHRALIDAECNNLADSLSLQFIC